MKLTDKLEFTELHVPALNLHLNAGRIVFLTPENITVQEVENDTVLHVFSRHTPYYLVVAIGRQVVRRWW